MPRNAWNEKDKDRKKEERRASSVVEMPKCIFLRGEPRSAIVGRTRWLRFPLVLHLYERNNVAFPPCFLTCRKSGVTQGGGRLDRCRFLYKLLGAESCCAAPDLSSLGIPQANKGDAAGLLLVSEAARQEMYSRHTPSSRT